MVKTTIESPPLKKITSHRSVEQHLCGAALRPMGPMGLHVSASAMISPWPSPWPFYGEILGFYGDFMIINTNNSGYIWLI